MNKSKFWTWCKAALVRAVRTFAQAAVACIGTSATVFSDINWLFVLSTSGLSSVLSILTSIITGLPEVETDDTDKYAAAMVDTINHTEIVPDHLPEITLTKSDIQENLVRFYKENDGYVSPGNLFSKYAAELYENGLCSFNPQNQPWCVSYFMDALYNATGCNKELTLALAGVTERKYVHLAVGGAADALTKITVNSLDDLEVGDFVAMIGEDDDAFGHCGYIVNPTSAYDGCMTISSGNCRPDSRVKLCYLGPKNRDINGFYRLHWEVLNV